MIKPVNLDKKYRSIQRMFNVMVKGLASQGWRPSVSEKAQCLYRGPGGTKCAIGWLLSDSSIDGQVGGLESLVMANRVSVCDETRRFLTAAQARHDYFAFRDPSAMRAGFVALAKSFNLKLPKELAE